MSPVHLALIVLLAAFGVVSHDGAVKARVVES